MTDQQKAWPDLKWQTDAEIRQWIADYESPRECGGFVPAEICPLLRELLSYRGLRFLPCWRVWVPDQSAQGWRWVAAFPDEGTAAWFRVEMDKRTSGAKTAKGKALVLPGNEQPALTAR